MPTVIYDFLLFLGSLIYLPFLLLKRKWHKGFWRRLGFLPEQIKDSLKDQNVIWVHAVSVGEVMAVSGLIEKMKEKFAKSHIVLTTVTQAGYTLAQNKMQAPGLVLFAPLDFSFSVNQYLKAIKPKLYVVAETEIWPNLFSALKRQRIPVVLVNGRLSKRSYQRYSLFKRPAQKILNGVDIFCMQTEADAKKMIELGVAQTKVLTVGNLKFDDTPGSSEPRIKDSVFEPQAWLWVAGSTHQGEERIVLKVFKELIKEFPHLRLILAPRHIERSQEVKDLVEKLGWQPLPLSKILKQKVQPNSIVIVDVIGHLRSLYSLSKIVFVGKSLTARGGHNVIEPAFFGNCILLGPHVDNFKDIVSLFQKDHGLVMVADAEELLNKMRALLRDPARIQTIGQAAKNVIGKNQGATQRTMTQIEKVWRTYYG